MMGVGFTAVLAVLGAVREILGQGTLFDGADQLLGDWALSLRIELWQVDNSFLLAMLPPGAFIAMGLLIAAKNVIDARIEAKKPQVTEPEAITRARITKVG